MSTEPAGPSRPGTEVEIAFAEVAVAHERARRAMEESQAGTDLQVRGSDAAAVKAQAAISYSRAMSARADLAAAHQRAKDAMEAQKNQLEEMLRQQMALLTPLMDQIKQAEEIIHTVNLYLGRDEQILTLASGTPAEVDAPLVLRQAVLAMDEESGARAATGGIDVRSIEDFDQWIVADPAHLQQVFPEQRGVVAITPRRYGKDYGDPWITEKLNEQNAQTWWLIRNGQNLYRMLTDFHVGDRLVPRRDEFTSMFKNDYTGEPLKPGSREWLNAEKNAGARERHFMKIALILQGLVDRTAVFAPLPAQGLNLLSPQDYDEGRVVLLADEEMALTSGRTPFSQWLQAKNSLLSPGHRVMIATHHEDFPPYKGGRYMSSGRHPRITPSGASEPVSGEVHTITRRGKDRGALVVSYQRTDKIWSEDGGYRTARTRASFTIQPGDTFVLPVDLVSIAEMQDYLDARTERHAYVDMFPTLQAAIAFKRAEAEAEAPFRDLLAAQIAQAEGIDISVAAEAVEEEVSRWKVGNRWHRPLVGEPEMEAKAAKAILTERARRASAASRVQRGGFSDEQAVTLLRERHGDALLIARRKSGEYLVLTPQPRRWARSTDRKENQWGRQVGPLNMFTTLHEYTASAVKSGRAAKAREWYVPAPAQVSRWVVLFEGESWATWNKRAQIGDHLTDPEIEAVVQAERKRPAPEGYVLLAAKYQDNSKDIYGTRPGFEFFYHPVQGFMSAERALTGDHPYPRAATQRVHWHRERAEAPVLTRTVFSERGDTWELSHDHFKIGDKGSIKPPWRDHGNNVALMVWIDEDVLAGAQEQAEEWNRDRCRREVLVAEARWLREAIQQAWSDRAEQEAKARFVEDYEDASLWEDHAKSFNFRAPFHSRWNVDSKYRSTDSGLEYLIERLVEDGRAPYGLTVAEAVALLGEDMTQVPSQRNGDWKRTVDGTIAEDVLTLRFPRRPE